MKRCRALKNVWPAVCVLLALRPEALLACSACYGEPDSPMAKGLNWAIAVLGGVVLCVLSAVAMFFVHVGKRSTAAPGNDAPENRNKV